MRLRLPSSVAVTAWAAGIAVGIFRLSSLRDLTNDHYMHLSWSQQVLLGDLPGRDFVDPGMPLAWGSSAIVQALAPGPFSEAAFSAVMFGITAALTCWVTARLTGSRLAGVAATALAAALVPRLYNYPKLLVPALTLFLVQRYVEHRSRGRLLAIAAGVAAAILYRHDLGLYASIVAAATLAVAHRSSPRDAVRAVAMTAGATLLILSPYLAYVQWSEGIVEHLRRGVEFSKNESHGLQFPWPRFPRLAGERATWSVEDAASLLYYVSWALPLAALLRAKGTAKPGRLDRLPLMAGATLFLALYLPIILRHPILQRLPDLATPLAIITVFVAQGPVRALFRQSADVSWPTFGRVAMYAGALGVYAATAVFIVNAGLVGGFKREIEDTRWERGPRGVLSKIRSLQQDGEAWPWAAFWPNSGDFPAAVLYVRACTSPDAYLLLTWPSSEYYFFAQRKFAAGHTMFLPPDAFKTDKDQAFMLARLAAERPPIALVNRSREEAFRRAYPRVDSWIAAHYTQAASYRHYDNDEIAIAIRNDLQPTSAFGEDGWPCGLVERPAQESSADAP